MSSCKCRVRVKLHTHTSALLAKTLTSNMAEVLEGVAALLCLSA